MWRLLWQGGGKAVISWGERFIKTSRRRSIPRHPAMMSPGRLPARATPANIVVKALSEEEFIGRKRIDDFSVERVQPVARDSRFRSHKPTPSRVWFRLAKLLFTWWCFVANWDWSLFGIIIESSSTLRRGSAGDVWKLSCNRRPLWRYDSTRKIEIQFQLNFVNGFDACGEFCGNRKLFSLKAFLLIKSESWVSKRRSPVFTLASVSVSCGWN